MDAEGALRRLSKPLSMSAGRIDFVPPGADEWLRLRGDEGNLTIFLLATSQRDGELEELHLRHRKSSGERQKELASKLAAIVLERATVKIDLPVNAR